MLLAVDIGNTTVAVAGLEGEQVAFVKRLPSDPALDWPAALRQLLEGVEAQGAVLSSVVPALTGPVGEGLKAVTGRPVLVVDKTTHTGLDLSGYDTANLGMDRVVDCVAALARWGGPAAVFDMGTATTLSVVDGQGRFLGGMILPGLALGLEALSARAAQLPPVELSPPEGLLGTNTASCMKYGALYGPPAPPGGAAPAGGGGGHNPRVLIDVGPPRRPPRRHRGHRGAAAGGAGRADGGTHRRQQRPGAPPAAYPRRLGTPPDLFGAGGDLETEYKKSKGINKIKFQQE